MESPLTTITANEVANYVVCPEAWRLKYIKGAGRTESPRTHEGIQRRQEWIAEQDLSAQLRRYAKAAYLLLLIFVSVIFLWDQKNAALRDRLQHDPSLPTVEAHPEFYYERLIHNIFGPLTPKSAELFGEIYAILIALGLIIVMWDLFERRSREIRKTSGLDEKVEVVALQGGSYLPGKSLSSASLGLSSTPNGLIREGKILIPVDFHPMSSKVKDRHIVQLLVHLRLLEEMEGKKPPHGVLIMGQKQRQVKVKNSPEKQRWLETLLDEIRSIRDDGVPTVPAPAPAKCRGCDVNQICAFSAALEPIRNNED